MSNHENEPSAPGEIRTPNLLIRSFFESLRLTRFFPASLGFLVPCCFWLSPHIRPNGWQSGWQFRSSLAASPA